MSRQALAGLAVLVLAVEAPAQASPDLAPGKIEWVIRATGRPASGDPRQITFGYHTSDGQSSTTGSARPLSDLQGLAETELGADATAPVRFELAADPGRLRCEGMIQDGKGRGQCAYEPSAGFADALQRLGAVRPGATDQLHMLVHGVQLAYVDELRRLGYTGLTAEQLISLRVFYVSEDFARELHGLGYRFSLDQLIAFRIFGVSVDYVRELHGLGYTSLSGDQLVGLRRGGVTPEFVRQANQGGRRLSPDELVHRRQGGG
jgi:hypothetical protein